jgi:hypothetical protein|tara:strand:+ start:472 stop:2337 length:1866 start_codon:yes stop_codon:yes gene_type:complete
MQQVLSLTIDNILDKASSGYYQIPKFQREFVWNNNQISTLVESALQGLPCGAVVTWENPDALSPNDYHHVRLEEIDSGTKRYIEFPPKKTKHNQPFIVIDGLQRITAISVAFGGLRNKNAKYRLGGKFFINLDALEIAGSISYKNLKNIAENNLDDPEVWKATGLFPLHDCDYPLKKELQRNNSSYWTSTVGPLVVGNVHRSKRVNDITNKVVQPIMAEMPLEKFHPLADIADSFELLNTQGTPVSMVDIIHSTLFEWFRTNKKKNWELREWIDSINDDPVSSGWGREKKRQIILQFGVAIELASSTRKAPRQGQSKIPENITNKDILNLNEAHWAELDKNTKLFKKCIYEFQKCVLGKQFPELDCPYPICASVYIALFWKLKQENPVWSEKRLNQIFRAFFWSNALAQGYETDSLRVPKDIRQIEKLLIDLAEEDDVKWKIEVDEWLTNNIKIDFPTPADIQKELLGKPNGALKQTLQLPIKYLPQKDLADHNTNITFPVNKNIQMHHIFPRKWVNDNQTLPAFGTWHSNDEKMKEIRECLANKTPLMDVSNNSWKAKSPATAMQAFTNSAQNKGKPVWKDRFINKQTYDSLQSDQGKSFLEYRAAEIQEWLTNQCELNL